MAESGSRMSIEQSKYYDKVIDGYLCTFLTDTHKCVSVMLATGMDTKAWKEFDSKTLGTIDPDYMQNSELLS